MGFGRILQPHPATHGQNEVAIAHVIGKFADLRWITLRTDSGNLHGWILSRCFFRH
jgi:hypothetical protein